MYLQFALLIAASAFLYGQTCTTEAATPPVTQELRGQVAAGIAPRAALAQAETAQAAARDAEFLNQSVALTDLTEEQAVQLEAAARRQLDRCTANLERARALVTAGLLPAQSLIAPAEEQAFARTSYDIILQRTDLVRQIADTVRLEEQILSLLENVETAPAAVTALAVMERFDGDGSFTAADLLRVRTAFEQHFHKSLPVSADGATGVHRALGYDHRNRVDVALVPDTAEGVWLRQYLEASAIPYYAFRSMIVGKATGAHIHIGPPSNRMRSGS